MLSFIDGRSVLGHVISTSGLPLEDAREASPKRVLRGRVVMDTQGGNGWSKGRT